MLLYDYDEGGEKLCGETLAKFGLAAIQTNGNARNAMTPVTLATYVTASICMTETEAIFVQLTLLHARNTDILQSLQYKDDAAAAP